MKQFLSMLACGVVCCCLSCNNEKTADTAKDNSAAQKNIAASHVVSEAFVTGDLSKIDSVIAPDFVDHTDKGDVGRDSLKAMITQMHNTCKDLKSETIKDLADDEYVMSWMRFKGTSDGSMGMPAGPFEMTSIETVRFKDGKAVEHWGFMEPREMMKMMPAAPPMTEKMESKDKMKGK